MRLDSPWTLPAVRLTHDAPGTWIRLVPATRGNI
jgi:hypothetical protein